MTQDYVGVDFPSINKEEAVFAAIHHLRLAAAFFEAGPEGKAEFMLELARKCTSDDDPTYIGAAAFLEALDQHYLKLAEDWPDVAEDWAEIPKVVEVNRSIAPE